MCINIDRCHVTCEGIEQLESGIITNIVIWKIGGYHEASSFS